MAKKKRFLISEVQDNFTLGGTIKIILDTETGVQYLYHASGYGAGMCPLLNPEGTPQIIDPSKLDS